MNENISLIILKIDEFLKLNNRPSTDPVEANNLLEKVGALSDSNGRPGKPLRNLLRKGLIPHAYQLGGKGSAWVIPHSTLWEIAENSIVTLSTPQKKTRNKTGDILDLNDVQNNLMNERNFKSAKIIDLLVPKNKGGIYCIRVKDINRLPAPFNNFLQERKHNIIYIGIASTCLNTRFLNQELRANGHGTFFRSLGAILGKRPLIGSLLSKTNKRNFKFEKVDSLEIIKWINDNLYVNWIEQSNNLDKIETSLIQKYMPLINIAKNPAPNLLLKELRKQCVKLANG